MAFQSHFTADYLLKIDGIDGESKQSGHEKWIEITCWEWGALNGGSSGTGSGAGSGRVSVEDFQFEMHYGISSPKLYLACCTGRHIPSACLHVRKAGGSQQVYVEWKFTDLVICRYETSHSTGDSHHILPLDKVAFNFTQIEMEYKPQMKDGTMGAAVTSGFNLKTGCKV